MISNKDKFFKALHNPLYLFGGIVGKLSRYIKNDKLYISLRYFAAMGKKMNWDNPQTYNEKLQWLKLYDHKPIYSTMVDKYEAKKYVANIIGDKYIIPTLAVYDKVEDIDFDALPNKFVLKCTHDSGGLVICRDKSKLDKKAAIKKLEKRMNSNYYYWKREWPYKNIKPRIIAEQYMEDDKFHDLRDYKFFCFDGKMKVLFIATERHLKREETKFDFFDADYKHLNIKNGHPNASQPPVKPKTFEEMKKLAEVLSKNIPQLRVDFYEVNGKTYFGELTFFHWSGMVPFDPPEWDMIFGQWIKLPKVNEE